MARCATFLPLPRPVAAGFWSGGRVPGEAVLSSTLRVCSTRVISRSVWTCDFRSSGGRWGFRSGNAGTFGIRSTDSADSTVDAWGLCFLIYSSTISTRCTPSTLSTLGTLSVNCVKGTPGDRCHPGTVRTLGYPHSLGNLGA